MEFIRRSQLMPKAMVGRSARGRAFLEEPRPVTPIDARQFHAKIESGVSIRLWLRPADEGHLTLYHCFANGPVAEKVLSIGKDALCDIDLECLGQVKTYTTDLSPLFDDEDRGVIYESAYLITGLLCEAPALEG